MDATPPTPIPADSNLPEPPELPFTQRRWKLLVGCGCLTIPLLLVGLALYLMVAAARYTKSIPAYGMALEAIRADAQAQLRLGTPIEDGFSVSVKAEDDGPRTNTSFTIPLVGSSAVGTAYVEAHKEAGVWTLDSIELEIDGETLMIMLPGKEVTPPPAPPNPPAPSPSGRLPAPTRAP